MAKRKWARCSTGHGTGVTPTLTLRTILDRQRARLVLKRGLRTARLSKVKAEQVEARKAFLGSREYRKLTAFIGIDTRTLAEQDAA